jgi:diguanylate cyclase (GGDEF)-like protein
MMSERSRSYLAVGFAVAFVLSTGLLDVQLGHAVHLFVFHLLAIGTVTWRYGRKPGVVIASLASVVWMLSGNSFAPSSHAWAPYWNLLSEVAVFFAMSSVLGRLRESITDVRRASETDALTGVNNRRALLRLGEQELRRSVRYKTALSVFYIDLDNFKAVNDAHGHPVGDALLTLVAQTAVHALRRVDVVARLGGDEFALLMPETNRDAAQVVARKLQRALDEQMKRYKWPVTFSIGICTFDPPDASLTVDDMLRQADIAMYKAKLSGKNRIQITSLAPALN